MVKRPRNPYKAFAAWLLLYLPFIPLWWCYNTFYAIYWRDLWDSIKDATIETFSLVLAPFWPEFWESETRKDQPNDR